MSDPNSTPDPNAAANEQEQPSEAQSADLGAEQLKAIIGAIMPSPPIAAPPLSVTSLRSAS